MNAIRDSGLRVAGPSGDRTVTTIRVADTAEELRNHDLYIIATKASGVEDSARMIAPLMSGTSMVLTIQNGLGAGERIAEHMPTDNVLLGVADGFGASMKGPGHAHHNAMNLIRIGEMGGGMTARLEAVTAVWQGAGFNAKAFEDINQLIWEKYICNATFSAACTVFDSTLGELMSTPDHWKVALGCTLEVYAVGRAKGINFSFDDPLDYVTAFGQKMPNARPSMLLDHMTKRRSEIDAINGMASVLGAQFNIPTPYNETLSAVIRAREAMFS